MSIFELSYLMFADPPPFQDMPEELENGSAWGSLGWGCMIFYLLLSTIVLVNILVAAMTHTYENLVSQLVVSHQP